MLTTERFHQIWEIFLDLFAPLLQLYPANASKGRLRKTAHNRNTENSISLWKGPRFDSKSQVRVLVSRECDYWGRKVLYDSKSVQKLTAAEVRAELSPSPANNASNAASAQPTQCRYKGYREEAENGDVYQYMRPCSDIKMLGEMVFGSVAMAYNGTMMKVHAIRSPPQLMISLVYPCTQDWSKKGRDSSGQEKNSHLQNSTSEILISQSVGKQELQVAHSVPVDVPSRMSNGRNKHFENSYATSGSLRSVTSNSSLMSYMASMESTCSHASSNSYNSLHRRWLRNLHTSMEFGIRQNHEESTNSSSNGDREARSSGNQRRIKVGLCAIITLDERNKEDERFIHEFFFSHITLIEGHVNRLKEDVAKAFLNRKKFVHIIYKGVEKLRSALQDLLTAPRFVSPAWLNMISPQADQQQESAKFMREFARVVKEFDTKQSNFFISTLLTCVLTHHLSWVPTIIPPDVLQEHSYHKRHSAPWLEDFAKSHPYNPLWMQLSDLCGAVGVPNKLVKIVVVGHQAEVLLRLLYVVSYFVRCSDVYEKQQERDLSRKGQDDEEVVFVQPQNYSFFHESSNTCSAQLSLPHKLGRCSRANGLIRYPCVCATKSLDGVGESKTRTECSHPVLCDYCAEHCCPNRTTKDERRDKETFPLDGQGDAVMFTLGSSPLPYSKCACGCSRTNPLCRSAEEGNDSLGYGSIDEFSDKSKLEHSLSTVLQDGVKISTDFTVNRCQSSGDSVSVETVSETAGNKTLLYADVVCRNSNNILNHKAKLNSADGRDIQSISEETVLDGSVSKDPKRSRECIDASKRYMKEYSCLRFEPNRIAAQDDLPQDDTFRSAHETFRSLKQETDSSLNGTSDADATEEGYRSMEDQLQDDAETERCPRHGRSFMEKIYNTLPGTLELCFPKSRVSDLPPRNLNACEGFSWSLLAGLSDHYMSDFCIQAVLGTADETIIRKDLVTSVQTSVLGEPILEAVAILADVNQWRVQLISSVGDSSLPQVMAPCVSALCESVYQMHSLNMSPEFCLMHLEDKLQEVYLQSKLLARCLCEEKSPTLETAASRLGIPCSDLPLLLSVAATHTPKLERYGVE